METGIEKVFARYPKAMREDLIPILQDIQDIQGYLDERAIADTAGYLNISTVRVYSLATFYDNFRFRPAGKNHIVVCRGTTCYLNRSAEILSAIAGEIGIAPGETSNDGLFSLELVSCLGACHEGAVMSVNGKTIRLSAGDNIKRIVIDLKKNIKDGIRF